MKKSAGNIIAYILLFIVLSPFIVLALYFLPGICLPAILYIIDRQRTKKKEAEEGEKKSVPVDMKKELKPYKYACIVLCAFALLVFYLTIGTEAFDPFTWLGYGCLQVVVFASFFPIAIYYILKLKKH